MPYKKGQSGNPGGRPKRGETMTDLLREKLETHKTTRDKKTRKEKILEQVITLAEAGDLPAIKYIFDRMDGKPIETIRANLKTDTTNMEKIIKKLEGALLR
jgi:ribosomal protein L17